MGLSFFDLRYSIIRSKSFFSSCERQTSSSIVDGVFEKDVSRMNPLIMKNSLIMN